MNSELREYHDQIRRNKQEGTSCCCSCPLRGDKYNGPALIECAEDYPEIVVVSESPAGRPEDTRDIRQWTRRVLMSCCKKSSGNVSSARDMGYFIGRLTRGKVYHADDPERTHNLYWTHTMKCFIQNKDIPIRDAKKEKDQKRVTIFRSGIKSCSKYLEDEIRKAGPANPKLVIAVGDEAYNTLVETVPKEKLCRMYHPGAWGKKQVKIEKETRLACLRAKVKEFGLTCLLRGCVDPT